MTTEEQLIQDLEIANQKIQELQSQLQLWDAFHRNDTW